LFYGYFTEGKNLSDVATLIGLGKKIGLTESEISDALTNPIYETKIVDDIISARNFGANGVPLFIINGKYAITGAQQPTIILKVLDKAFTEWQKTNPSKK